MLHDCLIHAGSTVHLKIMHLICQIHLTHTCMFNIIYIALTLYCSLDYDESCPFLIKHKSILHVYKSCLLSLCWFYRVVTTRGSSSPISRGSMTTPVRRPASCGGVSSPSTAWVRPRHTVTTTSSVGRLSSSPLTLTETVSCFSSSFWLLHIQWNIHPRVIFALFTCIVSGWIKDSATF